MKALPNGLPRAILLDLDDTILNDTGCVDACWEYACVTSASEGGPDAPVLMRAIRESADWFWADPDRHRIGRLDLRAARTEVARLALRRVGVEDAALAGRIGGLYHDRRDEGIELFPDSLDTLAWLRESAVRLALLTNGAGPPQRSKIDRFALERYFDVIFIEGELGFGKPDPRVYQRALEALDVEPRDAWMVGDNLEFDVALPQQLGIAGIWIDRAGAGHKKLDAVRPHRIIRSLSALRESAPS